MEDPSPHRVPMPDRRLPAWTLSVLLHLGTLLLVANVMERVPRGAADEPGRTAGIVLKRTSAAGDLYQGEADLAASADATADRPAPEKLMAALPTETSAEGSGADLPSPPAIGPGAAPGGGPDASQFTAGEGRSGSIAGEGQTRTSIFGVQGTGNKFVYLFDRSSSMEGPPLAAAKRQLVESIDSLQSVHQFQIIFFNHQLQVFDVSGGGRRIAFATDRNKQLAAKFIGGITADGGTDRFAALRLAVSLRPDVIFFLTDADDPMASAELAEIARLNRGQAMICVIEFGRDSVRSAENFLTQLASQSGGQYGYIDTTRFSP